MDIFFIFNAEISRSCVLILKTKSDDYYYREYKIRFFGNKKLKFRKFYYSFKEILGIGISKEEFENICEIYNITKIQLDKIALYKIFKNSELVSELLKEKREN